MRKQIWPEIHFKTRKEFNEFWETLSRLRESAQTGRRFETVRTMTAEEAARQSDIYALAFGAPVVFPNGAAVYFPNVQSDRIPGHSEDSRKQ